MGEDILGVIFLALICIIIAGLVYKIAPGEMMVPTFALIAVCLWIVYDYMTIQRNKAKAACADSNSKKHSSDDDLDIKINNLSKELNTSDDLDAVEDTPPDKSSESSESHADPLKPEQKHQNEFDIAMYDRDLSVQELYKDSGCAGDTRIANRMKYMGLQAKLSQDIRAKWNAEKFRPYFEEELRAGETRDWWDVEADYLDLLM